MNREIIRKSIRTFLYLGSKYSEEVCLDQIEAEFKLEYESLMQLVRDLQTDNGRLLTDKIIRESKIAELQQEQGEIVGWINAPYSLLKNDILEVIYYEKKHAETNKNPVHGHFATVPIRLPRKLRTPAPDYLRDDLVRGMDAPGTLCLSEEEESHKPEIPESVKAHLELLQKRADYQVATNVEQSKIARWILANLKDEVKPTNEVIWQPIETAPKYPMTGYSGPHFLADCEDGIREVWFEFPHVGSQAYAENYPPQIQWVCSLGNIGWVTEKPTRWIPLPKFIRDVRIAELEAEVARLTSGLKIANAGFEEYERKYYLELDAKEVAESRVEELKSTLRDRESTIVSQQEELHLLRPRVKKLESSKVRIVKENS